MPKKKPKNLLDDKSNMEHLESSSVPDSLPIEDEPNNHPTKQFRWLTITAVVSAVLILSGGLLVGFDRVYANKVVPGVSAAGVYLGGMSREQAVKAVQAKVTNFSTEQLGLAHGDTTLLVPISSLDYNFDATKSVDVAINYGRQGSFVQQTRARLRALLSRSTNVAVYSFNSDNLSQYLVILANQIDQPVRDASLDFSSGQVAVKPSVAGKRLDLGLTAQQIQQRLSHADASTVNASIYQIDPVVNDQSLNEAKHQADTYLSGPLNIKAGGGTYTADITKIISWITVSASGNHGQMYPTLDDLRPIRSPNVQLGISSDAVGAYVADIASHTDQQGQDAALTITDGRATVFQPSRDGIALDQTGAKTAIISALNNNNPTRNLTLNVKVTHPAITEQSLNDLGINELLSEGITYFAGSPANRMVNVRTGAARFNGVLLKPDEVFSFGALLGDVGPAQGYKPELVILQNHEEYQYGGGLCQVSSTAYRAALLAGLPILERHNHSFAVRYYTDPYGVPGVDATIYYPSVDLKFKNDTGHYILIQTEMVGTTLKFDYYGTKTKSGQLRGPYFVSGSNDATQPSTTVFYRDVLDLAGHVTSTDTVTTHYQSSTDFPVTKQFN